MVLWSYIATMTTDPGTVPPGWHPFEIPSNENTDLEAGESVAGLAFSPQNNTTTTATAADSVLNLDSLTSSLHDPVIATRLSEYFQASTRLQYQQQRNNTNLTTTTIGDDNVDDESNLYEAAVAMMERPRWCKKCKHCWKPPRCHHDSMTNRCVLKMDHYCVWVGNTVGLLNYKQFVLFLIWAFLGCFIR
jgi:DHHC palmitoyltransferase